MGLLIDTNVFIAAERTRQSASLGDLLAPILDDWSKNDALISVITVSELEMGVLRANTASHRERRLAFVQAVFGQFGIAPIDINVAKCHARLSADLLAAGAMIGTHDSWIAATGVAYGHAVVTQNANEFLRVPGLTVIPIRS